MSPTNYQRVKEFNTVFGHPAPQCSQINIFQSSPKIVSLRNSLIKEEITELNEALENEDVVEVIDALSDIQYVAYGLLVVYGVDGDQLFTEYVDEKYIELDYARSREIANMTNFNQTRQFIYNILNANTDFNPHPNTFLDRMTDPAFNSLFSNYLTDLKNAYNDLENATSKSDFNDTLNKTLCVIYNTYILGCLVGVDLDESIDLVHKSNMSKICSSEQEAIETVNWYKQNEKRYDSPNFRQDYSKTRWIVFNESTGKILKNINYKAVDLTKYLN